MRKAMDAIGVVPPYFPFICILFLSSWVFGLCFLVFPFKAGHWGGIAIGLLFLVITYEFLVRVFNVVRLVVIYNRLDKGKVCLWGCLERNEYRLVSSLGEAEAFFGCRSCLKRSKGCFPVDVTKEAKFSILTALM